EPEPAAGQRVQGGRGHRRHRRAARRDLHDRAADVDPFGLRSHPGQHGRSVRAVRLSRPRHGETELVGLPGQRQILGVVAGAPVPKVQSEPHARHTRTVVCPRVDREVGSAAMEQRALGRSGLVVSRLGLGTMTWGLSTGEDDAIAQLVAFRDAGGTLLDTADCYSAGASEEIIGRLWLDVVPRAEVTLATKACGRTGPGPMGRGSSRGHLLAALDASLERLRTDHVDLWQVHFWDSAVPLTETLATLDYAVSSGRA